MLIFKFYTKTMAVSNGLTAKVGGFGDIASGMVLTTFTNAPPDLALCG